MLLDRKLRDAASATHNSINQYSLAFFHVGCHGPGYRTPLDAMNNGPREQLLYVVSVQPNLNEPHGDYLSTIDVDPNSPTYSTIIHRTYTNKPGNELHHSGWNTCSSCHTVPAGTAVVPKRDKLVLPAVNSNSIYIFDVGANPRKPTLHKEVDGSVLLDNDVSAPHTAHCLADGTVLVSTMGDSKGEAKGEFIQFDSDFNCLGTWTRGEKRPDCGYDYWYQPYFDVMVASEWGAPKLFKRGFQSTDIDNPKEYGRSLNFYRWSDRTLYQTIDLGTDGITPLEVRFLHDPKKCIGFVGCALNSNLYCFYRPDVARPEFVCDKVVDIPSKTIRRDGVESEVGGMLADILISLDDKWLYLNNWLHGDVRQYDISDPHHPRLTGQLFLGGVANLDDGVEIVNDQELNYRPEPVHLGGRRLEGSPQMLQLSLDGNRLYVSSSLYSPWDKQVTNNIPYHLQYNYTTHTHTHTLAIIDITHVWGIYHSQFYPKMVEKGGHVVQIDVNTEKGGLTLNEEFFVDFGKEPYGPALPHEMRYPGGDCTSDIWLAED